MKISGKSAAFALWLAFIAVFALFHALHLSADFPNHSPWSSDWAKYTDEGWYGNAAVRAHVLGHWYLPGDFNPAPAVPVWPFLEWLLFFATGVKIEAARALAVSFFFANLALSYALLRVRSSRWAALLALTLVATSPFVYCFSRLAVLEPMLTALMLAALNIAIRIPKFRRPLLASVFIGLLFTLMMLTKSTAAFLLPALAWAVLFPLRKNNKLAIACALTAAVTFIAAFGFWMLQLVNTGLIADYKYLLYINKYIKPKEFYWPLVSFWWSFHGTMWIDKILIPLAGAVILMALLFRRSALGLRLLANPVFIASILSAAGYILFMTYQNHPQPRYFAFIAFFCFFLVAIGADALMSQVGNLRRVGFGVVALAALAIAINSLWTLNYALHPEYTFVTAAQRLTQYIDTHPNGNRLLVSISGDDISMITHLPALCDDFGTQELVSKLGTYQPGWYATWNDFDPGTLEDLHNRYSLEQVASFRAFDDPERNVLVLFKLHPLPGGQMRDQSQQNLQVPLPGDKIEIPIQ